MLFQLVAAALLAAASALAAASRGALGFALGAKQPNGDCKMRDDYEADFDAIAADSGSTVVRIYAASQCDSAKEILPAAKSKGFQVVLGIWPAPNDDESFNADMSAIQDAFQNGFGDQIYAVTVGSEALYRKEFTGQELADRIQSVQKTLSGVKVGTADSWHLFHDGTADAVIPVADILLCNAFSYWQGQEIGNATYSFFDDIHRAFEHIQKVSGTSDKPELWVGETGWPSAGTDYQAAEVSVENAERYYRQNVCGMVTWGFNVFSFEAFDEPWKPKSKGLDGKDADETHWGVMNADRSEKYSLQCS